MASAQLPGAIIRIYGKHPSGHKVLLFQGVNEQTGPGGSPDGAQATVKANELPYMPKSDYILNGGDVIVVTVELTAADGADASDSVWQIPITVKGQGIRYLTRTDFGYSTDLPASTPANYEVQLGAGYTIPENTQVKLGGANYFISVEDDTA